MPVNETPTVPQPEIQDDPLALARFKEPIFWALSNYASISRGEIIFEAEAAGNLEYTLNPDSAYTASSVTRVLHGKKWLGDLYVTAFKPWDTTGKTNPAADAWRDEKRVNKLPNLTKFNPKDRESVETEICFPIASVPLRHIKARPVMYANSMAIIGNDVMAESTKPRQFSHVGQTTKDFNLSMRYRIPGTPTAVYTVGFRPDGYTFLGDRRFGDPGIIANLSPSTIQVVGLFAISHQMRHYVKLLDTLGAIDPPNIEAL